MLNIRYSVVIVFFLLFPLLAKASTTTGTLPIGTVVSSNCSLNSVSLNFGNYNPIGANAKSSLDGITSFQVSCTKGASVVITMNQGLYSAYAHGASRAMSNGSGSYLSYELYSDAGYTTVWNGSNPLSYTSSSSAARTLAVYGRIPAGQNKEAGDYTDMVTITATF